jgi:putative spermidine/putrescine transport system ATP-binding protein
MPVEQGKPISIAVRRDRIKLNRGQNAPGVNQITGVVEATEYQGSFVKVTINVGGDVFVANVSDADYFAEPVDRGDAVTARWAAADVHLLSKLDTGAAGDPYANATH